MRNLCKLVAVISTAALLAGTILAQRPGGGGRGNLAALLGNTGVASKRNSSSPTSRSTRPRRSPRTCTKYRDDFANLKDAKPEERRRRCRN